MNSYSNLNPEKSLQSLFYPSGIPGQLHETVKSKERLQKLCDKRIEVIYIVKLKIKELFLLVYSTKSDDVHEK